MPSFGWPTPAGPSPQPVLPQDTGRGATDEAKRVKAQADLHELQTALERYYLDNGFYPTSDQGLQALVSRPRSGRPPRNYEEGGYIHSIPADPWGDPYIYGSDGNTYMLKCNCPPARPAT